MVATAVAMIFDALYAYQEDDDDDEDAAPTKGKHINSNSITKNTYF